MIHAGNSPPPPNNANFAWVQHIIHHLSPSGVAGFVLANVSMTSQRYNEGEIRKKLIEEGLVDCIIALPQQLFYSTQIPACLWFIARNRENGKFRNRINEILFISASKMGQKVSRNHRELTEEEIKQIAKTYHAWRGENYPDEYNDISGFCKSATIEKVRQNDYMLTPGSYVGVELQREDDEVFQDKISRLSSQWFKHSREATEVDQLISSNLEILGLLSKQENKKALENSTHDEKWSKITLGECAIINDHKYRPSEQWPFVNYLETGQITNNQITGIHHFDANKDEIPDSARRKVWPGDIVYSTVRPNKNHFGRIKDIPDNFLVSTAFAVIRGKPYIADTSYIYYYITQKEIIEYFHTLAEHSSSTYPSLKMRDLEKLQILLPPIEQQQSIAHILETFEEKMYLNQQMNITLEEMARALCESWFSGEIQVEDLERSSK